MVAPLVNCPTGKVEAKEIQIEQVVCPDTSVTLAVTSQRDVEDHPRPIRMRSPNRPIPVPRRSTRTKAKPSWMNSGEYLGAQSATPVTETCGNYQYVDILQKIINQALCMQPPNHGHIQQLTQTLTNIMESKVLI